MKTADFKNPKYVRVGEVYDHSGFFVFVEANDGKTYRFDILGGRAIRNSKKEAQV